MEGSTALVAPSKSVAAVVVEMLTLVVKLGLRFFSSKQSVPL